MMQKKLGAALTGKITRGRLKKFLDAHGTQERTLDIGSGGSPYAACFPNLLTVDISRLRKPEIMASAGCLPFRDASFSHILCTEVLEHLPEPQKALDEMRRVLTDGGRLILSTRFIFPLHDTPDDYYRFTRYGLKYLLRDWNIIEMEEETDTVGALAVLLQRIGLQCEFRFKPLSLLFHGLARASVRLGFLMRIAVRREYGVFYERAPEKSIMTPGYYVVAEKRVPAGATATP